MQRSFLFAALFGALLGSPAGRMRTVQPLDAEWRFAVHSRRTTACLPAEASAKAGGGPSDTRTRSAPKIPGTAPAAAALWRGKQAQAQ